MSTSELLALVSRSNPVEADPPAPPVGSLLARLDQTARGFDDPVQSESGRARRPARVRAAVACGSAAAVALGVLLAIGSSGGGTQNVLADVYRALAPGSGVVHMVEVTEQSTAGKISTTREEIWTAQDPRRLHSVTTPPDGKTYEQAFSASPLENQRWSEEEPDVILHSKPVGALTYEQTPVSLLRELVKKGEMTLVGQTTIEGRPVWQLAVHPVNYTQPLFEGKQLPNPTMYVDVNTFAPVELVSESLTHAGGQISGALELETATTRYTTYEEAPKDAQSESSLKLAEHPGAADKNEP